MNHHILLIEDEEHFRNDLANLLRRQGFTCTTAADGKEGVEIAEIDSPDIVLTDLLMPRMDGMEVVERLAKSCPDTGVILMTAFGSLESALDGFRRGAVDYILKPIVFEDLIQKINRCIEFRILRREVRSLRREVSWNGNGTKIIGTSKAMASVRKLVEMVAGTDSNVLITGETGTGKELTARAIHEAGNRRDRPFVAVNSAALPRELFESELFGHVRGAFTGASREKTGYFEVADGGTLFLDEIAEMPLELQPKLLRAIEQKQITRVGSTRPIQTSARIIAATNKNLKERIETGRFREDLYYRIAVIEIPLPALREKKEDIPLLVEHLIRRINARLKRGVLGVDNEAIRVLMTAPWKGNVRELDNVLERAILLADGKFLGIQDLPSEMTGVPNFPEPADDLRACAQAYEREHIRQVLAAVSGNREKAAQRLGINPSTLYRRLKTLEI